MSFERPEISPVEDSALVLQYTNVSDETVARVLIQEHYSNVLRFTRYLLTDPNFPLNDTQSSPLAEKAALLTFIEALRERKYFRGQATPSAWLLRIAYQVSSTLLRQEETSVQARESSNRRGSRRLVQTQEEVWKVLLFLHSILELSILDIGYIVGRQQGWVLTQIDAAYRAFEDYPFPEHIWKQADTPMMRAANREHARAVKMISAATLGQLSYRQQTELDMHLSGCPDCYLHSLQLAEWQARVKHLLQAQSPVPELPPFYRSSVEAWVLDQVAAHQVKRDPRLPQEILWIGLMAVAILAGVWFFSSLLADNRSSLPLFGSGAETGDLPRQWGPGLSADANTVVFASSDPALAQDDTNRVMDIFSYHQESNVLTLVSAIPNASVGDGPSLQPGISQDGRWVVFASHAENLEGAEPPICNSTLAQGYHCSNVYLYDQQEKHLQLISSPINPGEGSTGDSFAPAISPDGTFIVFWSAARNLVPLDEERCGNFWGQYNCLDLFIYERTTGNLEKVTIGGHWTGDESFQDIPRFHLSLSRNANWIALTLSKTDQVAEALGIANAYDTMIYSREDRAFESVNIGLDGSAGNASSYLGAITPDGRYVTFVSSASNLVQRETNNWVNVFVHDRLEGGMDLVTVGFDESPADSDSGIRNRTGPQPGERIGISEDGQFIIFASKATNLTNQTLPWWCHRPPVGLGICSNLFVFDRVSRQATQVNGETTPNSLYLFPSLGQVSSASELAAIYVESSGDCLEACGQAWLSRWLVGSSQPENQPLTNFLKNIPTSSLP